MAVGCAIAERFLQARFGDWLSHKTYTFISDGGVQEEISQGAGRLAGYLGLHNLIMFYDSNDIQLSTETAAVTREDTAAKYRAWNWNVLEVDGTDPLAMAEALESAINEKKRPTIIIGKTIMAAAASLPTDKASKDNVLPTAIPSARPKADLLRRQSNTSAPIPRIRSTFGTMSRNCMPTVLKHFAPR